MKVTIDIKEDSIEGILTSFVAFKTVQMVIV